MADALREIYARGMLGMRLGLEAMREASARVDHPESAFDVVHIAGTNGKGSTSAMVEAIARASGLRTGLYTSPHLCRFAERICVDGEPIADDALDSALARSLAAGPDLSFFEAATLAAFLAFRDARVDLAVLEVGLGGRLDATNIVPPPRCAAVTRIALDHQEMLGDTLDAIAREKAAIAKAGSPVVIGRNEDEARLAIRHVATRAGARIVEVASVAVPPLPKIALAGGFQRENAETAWVVARELGLSERARAEGLASVRWPGRFERLDVASGPFAGPWLLDGAHNPDGARALVAAITDETTPRAIVFGALADKAWPGMLDAIANADVTRHAPRIYVTPKGRAAAIPTALVARVDGVAEPSLESALSHARRLAGDGLVLVCGSLYLVGEARALLLGIPRDPPIAL